MKREFTPGLFDNWRSRCSSIGHILTDRKVIDDELHNKIKVLEDERDRGINANGNKVKWTDTKKEKLAGYISTRDEPDSLPTGAITHLNNIFRSKFWGRKKLVYNKYLDKGNIAEEDSLRLLSLLEDFYYAKNEELFSNEFIVGTPDNIQKWIKDMKTNYSMDTYDVAELTSLYVWQVKAYIWLLMKILKTNKGELIYALVNNPYHQLLNEKTNLYYKMGGPAEDDQDFIVAKQQLERNMIFDIPRWKEEYPNYDFENDVLDFSIPESYRIKRFDVELLPDDIAFMKSRVELARAYLIQKEVDEIAKLTA